MDDSVPVGQHRNFGEAATTRETIFSHMINFLTVIMKDLKAAASPWLVSIPHKYFL